MCLDFKYAEIHQLIVFITVSELINDVRVHYVCVVARIEVSQKCMADLQDHAMAASFHEA